MNRMLFCCCAISLFVPLSATAVTSDTVPVGYAGNVPDQDYGNGHFGAVGYPYRIGKTEVTNTQYAEFLNQVAATDTFALYNTAIVGITQSGANGSYSYATVAGRSNAPVNFVSWYDAIRFANWLHNGQGSGSTETGAYTLLGGTPVPNNASLIARNPGAAWFLPSEDEWYKAAYHKNDGVTGNYFEFPMSSDAIPNFEAPPGEPNTANYAFATGELTDVGAYTSSPSPYGTFDQGGNVWEWNEALVGGAQRIVRGGSYNDYLGLSDYLSARERIDLGPIYEGADTGFRVATAVPEPAALALLAVGLLFFMSRREAFTVLGDLRW